MTEALVLTTVQARSNTQLLSRIRPVWKLKSESRLQEFRRNYSTALEDQLSFAAEQQGPEFQHPLGCRQSERHARSRAQCPHEFGVRQWIRRRNIPRAFQFF